MATRAIGHPYSFRSRPEAANLSSGQFGLYHSAIPQVLKASTAEVSRALDACRSLDTPFVHSILQPVPHTHSFYAKACQSAFAAGSRLLQHITAATAFEVLWPMDLPDYNWYSVTRKLGVGSSEFPAELPAKATGKHPIILKSSHGRRCSLCSLWVWCEKSEVICASFKVKSQPSQGIVWRELNLVEHLL